MRANSSGPISPRSRQDTSASLRRSNRASEPMTPSSSMATSTITIPAPGASSVARWSRKSRQSSRRLARVAAARAFVARQLDEEVVGHRRGGLPQPVERRRAPPETQLTGREDHVVERSPRHERQRVGMVAVVAVRRGLEGLAEGVEVVARDVGVNHEGRTPWGPLAQDGEGAGDGVERVVALGRPEVRQQQRGPARGQVRLLDRGPDQREARPRPPCAGWRSPARSRRPPP